MTGNGTETQRLKKSRVETISPARHFLTLFIPLLSIIAIFFVLATDSSFRSYRETISARQTALLSLEGQNLANVLRKTLIDLHLMDLLISFHTRSTPLEEALPHMSEECLALARANDSYAQIRYLTPQGMELIRIERREMDETPFIATELQDKSLRDYYTMAHAFQGDVVLSRFDLNMEHGRLEYPYKPMLRLVRRHADAEDTTLGYLVVNLQGSALLDHMSRVREESDVELYLLNDKGQWLMGPSPAFDFSHINSPGLYPSFARLYPALWEEATLHDNLTVTNHEGMFSFLRVDTSMLGPDTLKTAESWYMVSLVPSDELVPPRQDTFSILFLALGAAAGAISLIRTRNAVRRQKGLGLLRESEEKFRSVTNAALEAIFLINGKGIIIFANQVASDMTGHSHEELLGQDLHLMLASQQQAEEAANALPVFSRTGNGDILGTIHEVRCRRKDGSNFVAELSVSRLWFQNQWHAAGVMRDISKRKQAEEQLRILATTDSLTGLTNRRRFMELAASELERGKRYGHDLSMIMLDVDHFKKVNDTYGHDVGDRVLIALSRKTESLLREVDVLARLGGEEFAILVPETGLDGAMILAERIRMCIERMTVRHPDGELSFTISLGVATAVPPDLAPDVGTMLKLSDDNLYAAKHGGRNRTVGSSI